MLQLVGQGSKALPIYGCGLFLQKSLTNIGKLRHDRERETKGELAQLVEHYDGIVGVSGSSPLFSIKKSKDKDTAVLCPYL